MAPGSFRFEDFSLDVRDRQLKRADAPVELNARYLDALALLVRENGRLVSKDRFLEEVWRGVPVTDEALTQCVKTLRRQLGDDAGRPRFIETVPKHGYRFIAPVEWVGDEVAPVAQAPAVAEAPGRYSWAQFGLLGGAGMIGGGLAGVFIGLFYGFGAAPEPLQTGVGATSVLMVLVCLSVVLGLIAGAGVGFGVAAAGFAPDRRWLWSIAGGAAGGLLTGAFGKLIGLDAFNLLFGHSPGAITGAAEGALIGGAMGLGAWLSGLIPGRRLVPSFAAGGLAVGLAAAVVPLAGGRLMGGSLDLLARQFPESQLSLAQIGAVFGETGFGPISQTVTGGFEGLMFGGWVVAAMMLARRLGGLSAGKTEA
ncbi:DNA-binding winged helix-turn-helix (wHTH) protein [Brevundimonas alba]|uniref:DNA-binding winged helix-turn-helix (WHTH) protein n=1 Tax=Brevundimonas alba TaxID=74314 RepID=A0A7X5YPG5_9CAUL|nr:transcriptional regulator [Brevundimonas alba]NJC42444.1 DNA-binding winged helix-turn-helix (wHTH) protein [Brevundimonas alba]